MGSRSGPSTRNMSSPRCTIVMQMMTTMVEIVEMDSETVIIIKSAEVVKSLKILDMRTNRTALNIEEMGIFSSKA
jgi:hypothetical protein